MDAIIFELILYLALGNIAAEATFNSIVKKIGNGE